MRSGAMLKGFCAHAVNQSLPAEDESHAYYVSALITRMLEHGHPFQVRRLAYAIATLGGLGNPSQPVDGGSLQGIRAELLSTINNPTKMNAFLDRLGHNPQLDQRKMRIVFNLDNTLVTLPADPADYSSVRPVADMVDLVRAAFLLRAANSLRVGLVSRTAVRTRVSRPTVSFRPLCLSVASCGS
jgi:hypothetical protein